MGPEGQYVTEVKRLLSLLGLEVQGQFPVYLPFPEWANAPAAELAIVLGTTGQSDRMNGMADLLEKNLVSMPLKIYIQSVGKILVNGFLK